VWRVASMDLESLEEGHTHWQARMMTDSEPLALALRVTAALHSSRTMACVNVDSTRQEYAEASALEGQLEAVRHLYHP
jgi:hypothetical protein